MLYLSIRAVALEKVILVRFTVFVVIVVLVRISKELVLHFLRLNLFYLVLLLGFLCLSLDFAFGLLDLFVLDHVARFDDVCDGSVV